MASSIKSSSSSTAVIKVWKAKKKKLHEKLNTVFKAETEVRAKLQQYVDQRRERVKDLLSKEDIVVFNQEYEDVSSSLDMCINALFDFQLSIELRIDNLNSDSDSHSSDEVSFKSIVSETASAGTYTGRESSISMDEAKSLAHSTPFEDTRIVIGNSNKNSKTTRSCNETLEELPALPVMVHYQESATSRTQNFDGHSTSNHSRLHQEQSQITGVNGAVQISQSKFNEPTTTKTQHYSKNEARTNSLFHQEQSPIPCVAEVTLVPELKDVHCDQNDTSTTKTFDDENVNSPSPEFKVTPETFMRGLDGIVNDLQDPSIESLASDVQEEFNVQKPNSSSVLCDPHLPLLAGKEDAIVLKPNHCEDFVPHITEKPHLLSKSHSSPSFETKFDFENPVSDSNNIPTSNKIVSNEVLSRTSSIDIQSDIAMQAKLQQCEKVPVKVTHINGLDDFFVSLNPEGTSAIISHLCDYYMTRKDTLQPTTLLKSDNQYMALISPSQIIRCQLLSCIENIATIQNLDVGNVLKIEKSALYDLPDHTEWPYVLQCALNKYHLIIKWNSPEIVNIFKEACKTQTFLAKFHQHKSKYVIELYFKYRDSECSILEYFHELNSMENSTRNTCDDENKTARITSITPHASAIDVDSNSSSGRSTPDHSFEWKASIKTPYCPDVKDGSIGKIPCIVSYVDSPSNFYVQFALEESGTTMISDQLNNMNMFYSSLKLKEPVYKKVAVQPNSFWCCQNPDSEDSNWYRVQILSFVEDLCSSSDTSSTSKVSIRKKKHRSMNPTTMLQALCVDYGDTITVMLKDLYPLTKQFLMLPALAVQCSLAHITPVNDEFSEWSKEPTIKFIEFASLENMREMEILEITRPGSYIVHLFNDDGIAASNFLIEEHLAIKKESDPDVGQLERFNPMEEEFQSDRNNLTVDVDDACVAVTGYKPKDELYICQSFQNRGYCRNIRSCNYVHEKTSDTWTCDKEMIACDISITMPKAEGRVFVEIAFVFNPSHFYIKCPYGMTDAMEFPNSIKTPNGKKGPDENLPAAVMDLLQQQMNEHYNEKSSFFDNLASEPALGSIVACRYSVDTQDWYRARVIGQNDDEEIQVFYVDYGNREWIPRGHVREIMQQFLFLPQQAIECYLYNICPANSSSWSQEASDFFASQTDGKLMVAKVMSVTGNSLYIDLYNLEDGVALWLNNLLVTKGFAEKCRITPNTQSQSDNESCYSSTEDFSQTIQYYPG